MKIGSIQKTQVGSRLRSDKFPTNQIRESLRENWGFLLYILIEISAHAESKYFVTISTSIWTIKTSHQNLLAPPYQANIVQAHFLAKTNLEKILATKTTEN